MIQAKPVRHPIYGYDFRSQEEAKKAVYVEAMAWRYYYESRSIVSPINNQSYLADFDFPDFGQIVESKPNRFSLEKEAESLAKAMGIKSDHSISLTLYRLEQAIYGKSALNELFRKRNRYLIHEYENLRLIRARNLKCGMYEEAQYDFTVKSFIVSFGPLETFNQWRIDRPNAVCEDYAAGVSHIYCWLLGHLDGGFGWVYAPEYVLKSEFERLKADIFDADPNLIRIHDRAVRYANGARFDHGKNTFLDLEKWRQLNGNEPYASWIEANHS